MPNRPTNIRSVPHTRESDDRSAAPARFEISLNPRIAEIAAEGDRRNLAELHGFHQKTEGHAETINTLDAAIKVKSKEAEQAAARWMHFGNLARPWTPFRAATVWVVVMALVLAETVLTATVMAGLDLPDAERWFIAVGVTLAATFLGIKGGALGWRAIADDEHDGIPVARKDRIAARINVVMVLVLLGGQFLARESYAIQSSLEAGSSSGGVSDLVAGGLTLLQAGLYGLVGCFFYKHFPHLRSMAANVQHDSCRRVIEKLHKDRAKISARLNRETFQLMSKWADNIAQTKTLVYEYLAELDIERGDSRGTVEFLFDERIMLPMPPWVWRVVDPQPALVQSCVENGPSTPAAMEAQAQQRDLMMLGKAYPPASPNASPGVSNSTPKAKEAP